MSRFNEKIKETPVVTLGIIGFCIVIYLCQMFDILNSINFTLCPQLIIGSHEYYRIITSPMFHGSIMHIMMNMMSTIALSATLEKHYGSIRHLVMVSYAILLTSIVYTIIAIILKFIIHVGEYLYTTHSLGFSSVLFHMLVLECNTGSSPRSSRSLFGSFSVPSYLYPFTLLIILQILLPNISFLGHLSGIITGTLQLYGYLDCIMLSDSTLQHIENLTPIGTFLSRYQSFVPFQQQQQPQQVHSQFQEHFGYAIRFLKSISTYVGQFIEAVKVIIFGRGREANANIYLGDLDDDNDDDELLPISAIPHATAQKNNSPSEMV